MARQRFWNRPLLESYHNFWASDDAHKKPSVVFLGEREHNSKDGNGTYIGGYFVSLEWRTFGDRENQNIRL